MIKYAIALAVLLAVAAFVSWAFLPARYLPNNRARYSATPAPPAAAPRQRLRHGLQPVAALGPPGSAASLPPDPPLPSPVAAASSTRMRIRCSSAGPTTGTACGSRWKSTCC